MATFMTMSLAHRFTFERKYIGNDGLSVFFCVDLERDPYCLHRYHVKQKALHNRGVADLANFGFEDGQAVARSISACNIPARDSTN